MPGMGFQLALSAAGEASEYEDHGQITRCFRVRRQVDRKLPHVGVAKGIAAQALAFHGHEFDTSMKSVGLVEANVGHPLDP